MIHLKYDFSEKDKEIYEIYKTFTKYYRRHLSEVKEFLPKNRDPRKSANWKHFAFVKDLVEKYESIILDKFILSQVLWVKEKSNSKICNPNFLSTERSIDRYVWFLKYGEKLIDNECSDYETLYLEILKQNAIFLLKEKKLKGYKSFKEMFLEKEGTFPKIYNWVLVSKVDNIFLSISKSYYEIYYSLDSDVKGSLPSPEQLLDIRRKIVLNKTLKEFCHKIFKDECNIK
jgi:hypothetical protein